MSARSARFGRSRPPGHVVRGGVSAPAPARWRSAACGFVTALATQVVSHALLVYRTEITPIWLPGAFLLAYLLVVPSRRWPAFVSGFVLGGVTAFYLHSGMLLVPLVGYCWLSGCIVAGACMLKAPLRRRGMFPGIADLMRFILVMVVGTSVACAVGFVGLVSLIRDDVALPRLWLLSMSAYAVAFMLVTPLLVEVARLRLAPWREIRPRVLQFLLLTTLLWTVSVAMWHAVPSNLSSIPLILFAPVPLLVLAAFQFGSVGPSLGLVVAFVPAIIFSVLLDRSDTSESVFLNTYVMQMWALAAGVLVHALAIQARQRQAMAERLIQRGIENRSLAARIIHSQEEAGARIARELHDNVCQKLSLHSVALSTLARDLPDGARAGLDDVRRSIRGLMDEIRGISRSLHPPVLEHVGLAQGIEDLARSVDDAWDGVVLVRSRIDPAAAALSPDQRLCMYRIAQESLRNAIEHSGATAIRVSLVAVRHAWRLSVVDNGNGFDVGSAGGAGGMGLPGMRERATVAGGVFRMRSVPGRGTCVAVEIAP